MNIDQLSNLFLEKQKNLDKLNLILKKYNLQYLLPQIISNLEKKDRLLKERNKTVLEVPMEIELGTLQNIEEKYNQKIKEVKIDKTLVLGFKLKTVDKVIDSSLKALFKNFTK